jgi:hypothetical protein
MRRIWIINRTGRLAVVLMLAATGENRAGDPADTWASRLLSARRSRFLTAIAM